MREELRPYEGQYVLVRGLLKETTHHIADRYDCLFVSCVWKPVLEGEDKPFAEVPANKTDHLWVRVPSDTLNEWRRENPTSLLLKRLEKVFRVERYQRADGSEDFGLVLPTEDWRLISALYGRLKVLRREHGRERPRNLEELRVLFEKVTDDVFGKERHKVDFYTSLDSTTSTIEAYTRLYNEVEVFVESFFVKLGAHLGGKVLKAYRVKGGKVKQKQGPKPGRGF